MDKTFVYLGGRLYARYKIDHGSITMQLEELISHIANEPGVEIESVGKKFRQVACIRLQGDGFDWAEMKVEPRKFSGLTISWNTYLIAGEIWAEPSFNLDRNTGAEKFSARDENHKRAIRSWLDKIGQPLKVLPHRLEVNYSELVISPWPIPKIKDGRMSGGIDLGVPTIQYDREYRAQMAQITSGVRYLNGQDVPLI